MGVDNARKEPKAHSFPKFGSEEKNTLNNKGLDAADGSFGRWLVRVHSGAGRLVIGRSRPEPK